MFSIAFICTANVCRSVMAHAICAAEVAKRGWNIELYSGGVMDFSGTPAYQYAWMSCCQHGTPLAKEGSTFVGALPLPTINRFLVMEERHAEELVAGHGIDRARITLLASFDPEGGGPEIDDPITQGSLATERCYLRLRRCVTNYLDTAADIPRPT